MLVLTVALTAVVSLALGMAPAKLARRRVRQRDLNWSLGLWLATWVFALCAYHRPGLAVGFDTFRLIAITALCGWASFCVAGLRSFGSRGLRFVVPLLLAAALGGEVFVGNVTYFNTHSYEPFQLLDYMDPNVNVIREQGSISLDESHTYMRFLNIDRPIYNLSMDGLTNDDADPLHLDSFFSFRINASDEANTELIYFGTWQMAPQSTRSQAISLDLTGNVSSMELTASGYSSAFAEFPLAVTFTGITANTPRPFRFSWLRFGAVLLALLAVYALRPQSGLWHRRWLAGNVCDRAAGVVLAVILAVFIVVVPFWEPGNTGVATKNYNVAFWDGENKVSFIYEQYGALAHSLLNGRLDLEEDPPEELLALDNPYDPTARSAAQANSRWDHAYYNGRYYVYFGVVPCLLFQLPFEAITGIQNLAYPPCMVVMGLLFLLASFGAVNQVVRRWFSQASSAAYLLSVAALVLGSQLYYLFVRPYIYEYAIVCGASLLMVGLWLWLSAANTPVEHRGALLAKLALGSLCVALVAGCRPQMELFAVLALPIFWQRYIAQKRLCSRAGAGEAVAFLLPVILVAAGLMWYNYARFGSPFDFGANYNLTGNDMTRRGFNVVRIGPAVFTSLFDLPRLKSVFPFLQETEVATNAIIRTISEPFVGGMLAATPFTWVLGALFLPQTRQSLRRRPGAAGMVWLAVAGMAVITVVDCEMAGVLYRYLMDYSPVLLLGAAFCWLLLESVLARRAAAGETLAVTLLPVLRMAMAAAVAWGAVYRFFTLFATQPWLQGLNPSLYFNVARLVQFWM